MNRLDHPVCSGTLFNIRPKAHYLGHISQLVERIQINPKAVQTLSCETFLGKIKLLGKIASVGAVSDMMLPKSNAKVVAYVRSSSLETLPKSNFNEMLTKADFDMHSARNAFQLASCRGGSSPCFLDGVSSEALSLNFGALAVAG